MGLDSLCSNDSKVRQEVEIFKRERNIKLQRRKLHRHHITLPVPEGVNPRRLSLFKLSHCLIMLQDLMVICAFPAIDYDTKLDLIKAVTGWVGVNIKSLREC